MRKRAKHTLLPEASLDSIIVALKSVRGSEGHRGSSLENKQTALKGTKASIMVGTGAFQKRWFNEKVMLRANRVEGGRSSAFLPVPSLPT